jgi:hypothetical protein
MFILTDSRCLFPMSQRPIFAFSKFPSPVSFNLSQRVGPAGQAWMVLADAPHRLRISHAVFLDERRRLGFILPNRGERWQ